MLNFSGQQNLMNLNAKLINLVSHYKKKVNKSNVHDHIKKDFGL